MPKITLNIEADSVQELKNCMEQFAAAAHVTYIAETESSSENGEEKKKDRPKKQVEQEPEKAKPAAPKIDFRELRTEAMNKALDKGQNKVADIITSFGSDSLSGIPEEKYPELMAKLKAL